MIIRTSKAKEPSFTIKKDQLIENDDVMPYYLYREDLRAALKNKEGKTTVTHYLTTLLRPLQAPLKQGKIQRGKKFLQIGCKRFVGVNRLRLIRWAK